jgi:quercetin dioxygenase-like cupin family protein
MVDVKETAMQNPVNSPTHGNRGSRAPGRSAMFAALAGAIMVSSLALAGSEQVTRTELYKSDLAGSDNTEVIVAQLELVPGATVPRHSHNGEEHLIVLQGGTMAMPNGDVMEFLPGVTMDFPRDFVHGGLTATGDRPMVFLTVHIVDKNAPQTVAAQ